MEVGGYPENTEYDKDAPWNEKEDLVSIGVNICVCTSKFIEIPIEKGLLDYYPDLRGDALYDAADEIVTKELRSNNWIVDNLEIFEE